ncbi:helix-turn-helix transcriptional regulator [Altererythrobacter lutimaris]|uniref:AlpA family phage regulatory protein n=1 Tax=Altererythrobacter lutimaris TaxID=2743979 RepID=A0A850HBT1_9SPHN|nr:AlpA family phage regulatory protein [Altererythrobacter lutimaris]NVE94376.1 AlpA family phage regulatory protein [Altererythrobacter lutimaris]
MVEQHGPISDLQESQSGGISEPPERLLRLPEVMERVGLKRTAIFQRMKEGRFPASRSLGPRCTVWVESEVQSWVQTVANSRPETR